MSSRVPVEAIDGLEEIVRRWIEESPIRVLRLEPGDAIVIRAQRRLTQEQAAAVIAQVQGALGETVPVLVFPPDFELEDVVRRADS